MLSEYQRVVSLSLCLPEIRPESSLSYCLSESNRMLTSDLSIYSFENLVVFLREKHTIFITKNCLQRIHMLSTFLHGCPHLALTPQTVNVRVFLAGFMIAFRPSHVFESMGALEQSLFEAALPLMTNFQRIVECTAACGSFQDVPRELTREFPSMLFEYLKRFKAWKIPDETKLVCRIKHALVALYQAETHVPPDEPKDSKLRVEFRQQIERLRSKLSQIAGPLELTKFDAARATGDFSVVVTGSGNACNSAYSAVPGRMTNEQLAHELLLDPAFQLDDSGGSLVENSAFHRIRESFHKVFFYFIKFWFKARHT